MTTTTIPYSDTRLMTLLGDANNVLIEEGLLARGWRIVFNDTKRRAGQCDFRRKTVEVSLPWARLNTDEDVWDVFMHEIAHALTDPLLPDHGDEWKATAVRLGARPTYRTPRTAVPVPGRYAGHCDRCDDVKAYRHKRTKGMSDPRVTWHHRGCSGRLTWTDTRTGQAL